MQSHRTFCGVVNTKLIVLRREAVQQFWSQIRGEHKVTIGNPLVERFTRDPPDGEPVNGVVVLEMHPGSLVDWVAKIEEEICHGLVTEGLVDIYGVFG